MAFNEWQKLALSADVRTSVWRARGLLAALVLASLLFAPAAAAAQFSPSEVEAVYLFNFARFVEWPSDAFTSASAPFVIGIVGRDPFGPFLDEVVKGERIVGRPIVVQRFSDADSIGPCHILFVSRSASSRLEWLLSVLKGRHVLTVSDIADFGQRGGIIQFLQENDRIRFRINRERAKEASLEISSKLLRPAELVTRVLGFMAPEEATLPELVPAAVPLVPVLTRIIPNLDLDSAYLEGIPHEVRLVGELLLRAGNRFTLSSP